MQLDPFARAVYAFHNRRRNRIKLLLWDRNGFWLLLDLVKTKCAAQLRRYVCKYEYASLAPSVFAASITLHERRNSPYIRPGSLIACAGAPQGF
ncbi:transposase (plasmid) [Cupriavidus sp. Agwp_2]